MWPDLYVCGGETESPPADLDVFFVVWDSGEKLLPPHQLSEQLGSFLQAFDQWLNVVVHRLPVNLHIYIGKKNIYIYLYIYRYIYVCLLLLNEHSDLLDVPCGQPLRPQELENGPEVGTVPVDEDSALRVAERLGGPSGEQLGQLGVRVLPERAQRSAEQLAPDV